MTGTGDVCWYMSEEVGVIVRVEEAKSVLGAVEVVIVLTSTAGSCNNNSSGDKGAQEEGEEEEEKGRESNGCVSERLVEGVKGEEEGCAPSSSTSHTSSFGRIGLLMCVRVHVVVILIRIKGRPTVM